jgi:hypothetical protein
MKLSLIFTLLFIIEFGFSETKVICQNGEVVEVGTDKASMQNACADKGGVKAYSGEEMNVVTPQAPNINTVGSVNVSGDAGASQSELSNDFELSNTPTVTNLPDYSDTSMIYNPINIPEPPTCEPDGTMCETSGCTTGVPLCSSCCNPPADVGPSCSPYPKRYACGGGALACPGICDF